MINFLSLLTLFKVPLGGQDLKEILNMTANVECISFQSVDIRELFCLWSIPLWG